MTSLTTEQPIPAYSVEPAVPADDRQEEVGRERSTIKFPYGDLEDAEVLARAVWRHGGTSDLNQLAAELGHESQASGAFKTKLATARHFGVVAASRTSATLTPLGRDLVSDTSARRARVAAFMHVPLYRRIYEDVTPTGGHLPEDRGIEAMMQSMGVVKTQVNRARQAFQRSARQAGFTMFGERRLVMPVLATVGSDVVETESETAGTTGRDEEDGLSMKPAIIVDLFKVLPDKGADFPAEQRQLWLDALTANLNLVYGKESKTALTTDTGSNEAYLTPTLREPGVPVSSER